MTKFGPYTLLRPLGKGGMAEVFLAKAVNEGGFERLLAIKRLLPPFNIDDLLVSMLADEARLSVWLTHPNVVQVLDFGCVDKTYYIAMEYVDGCDLCKMIRKKGRAAGRPLPLATALYVIGEVADALDYAHRRADSAGRQLQIIHRDVSPHNVLVSREGQVKLADFGLARASISVHQSHAGVIRGKFAYMPKEQAHGRDIDHRIDIFAAGATLYEALTGVRPYSAANLAQQLYQLEQPIPPPSTHMADIPEEIDDLTMQALAPDADSRYQTAEDLATDLRHALANLSTPNQEAQQLAALVKSSLGPSPAENVAPGMDHAGLRDIRTGNNSLIGDAIAKVQRTLSGSMERRRKDPEDHDTFESVPDPRFASVDDSVPTANRNNPAQQHIETLHDDELAPTNLVPTPRAKNRALKPEKTALERKKRKPLKKGRSIVRGTIADSDVHLPSPGAPKPLPKTMPLTQAPERVEFEEAETTLRPKEEARAEIERELRKRRQRRPAEEAATERLASNSGSRKARAEPPILVIILGGALLLALGGTAGWLARGGARTPCPKQRPCPTVAPISAPVTSPVAQLDASSKGVPFATSIDAAADPPKQVDIQPPTPKRTNRPRRRPRVPVVRAVKLGGYLTVTANKAVIVLVNGKAVGRAPLRRYELKAGTYQVKVQNQQDGSYSSTRWITVAQGAEVKMRFSR